MIYSLGVVPCVVNLNTSLYTFTLRHKVFSDFFYLNIFKGQVFRGQNELSRDC